MNRPSRNSFFLMEIILSLLLFSLTAAVCTQLFVRTHLKEKQAKELQFSVTEAETVTSLLRSSTQTQPKELLSELGLWYSFRETSTRGALLSDYGNSSDPAFLVFFDKDFQNCTSDAAEYRMTLFLETRKQMTTATLRFDFLGTGRLRTEQEPLYQYTEDTLIQTYTLSLYRPNPVSRADKEDK